MTRRAPAQAGVLAICVGGGRGSGLRRSTLRSYRSFR
jgi:hypothetical protein